MKPRQPTTQEIEQQHQKLVAWVAANPERAA